jgi:hypothetical protein
VFEVREARERIWELKVAGERITSRLVGGDKRVLYRVWELMGVTELLCERDDLVKDIVFHLYGVESLGLGYARWRVRGRDCGGGSVR